jgi:hypothetical protein
MHNHANQKKHGHFNANEASIYLNKIAVHAFQPKVGLLRGTLTSEFQQIINIQQLAVKTMHWTKN